MKIFHIPTTALLNLFLIFSTEIREFCCFYDDVPLGLKFFDEDFYKPIDKEFETPEDQKYCYDNASLKPVIKPFLETLENTSNYKFRYFLGDLEFDSYDNFGFLQQCGFEKVFIPLNPRNQGNSKLGDLEYVMSIR